MGIFESSIQVLTIQRSACTYDVSNKYLHMPKSKFTKNPNTMPTCVRRLNCSQYIVKLTSRRDSRKYNALPTLEFPLFPKNRRFCFAQEEKWYDWEEEPNDNSTKNETLRGGRSKRRCIDTIHRVYPLLFESSGVFIIYDIVGIISRKILKTYNLPRSETQCQYSSKMTGCGIVV